VQWSHKNGAFVCDSEIAKRGLRAGQQSVEVVPWSHS